MTLSAALFDMDGLIVDTEPVWLEAEYETLAELGGTWSEADQRAIMGSSMPHATAYMRRVSGTDRTDAQIAELLVGTMLRKLDGAEIPIRPGAPELVAAVASSGLPFALVSASVRPIVDLVRSFLVRRGMPEFPVTVAGDEVERGKPDPLPYLRAAAMLGVDIGRAVVLEDSANGVRAGWAAGATVLAVPHAVAIEPGERVIVRPSLVGLTVADLRALVEESRRPAGVCGDSGPECLDSDT